MKTLCTCLSGKTICDCQVLESITSDGININRKDMMFVFIQSDIFAKVPKQDNASFMENSAGLGFRLFKGLSVHLGYQGEDYNPVTKERREDRPNVKISWKFRL